MALRGKFQRPQNRPATIEYTEKGLSKLCCKTQRNLESPLFQAFFSTYVPEKAFSVCIKDSVFIDPPYNIGAMNEYYDDLIEHSLWLNRMRPRIEILRNLLCDEGVIFIQISDEEQAYLKILCDEIFGRNNFVNTVSVNMKNIAGASGGGEDKRLKKNCEYILIYAKNYESLPLFNGPYEYTELSVMIEKYINQGKSWKYTTVLVDSGEKDISDQR